MKLYAMRKLQQRRALVEGRWIIGIDPAKARHDAVVIDPYGLPVGRSFSFAHNLNGFNAHLWKRLEDRVPHFAGAGRRALAERVVFAIETSCNLWVNLADWLFEQGFCVVLVSPLSTHHARPARAGDFSHTDERDAYLIADLARQGTFYHYRRRAPELEAMHRLSITYCKLRRSLQQACGRLRAEIELVFPELLTVLKLDSLTARYLLARYLFPDDYLALDVPAEAARLMNLSHRQHGSETLRSLQAEATRTIALRVGSEAEREAHRSSAAAWLDLMVRIEAQAQRVGEELIALARATPWHSLLTSLKGVSDLTAALFIAEVGDLDAITHRGQIERSAGINLRLKDSGQYHGPRRISRLGNRRLRWVLFQMASETSKYVPEVRAKYLRRRASGHGCRRKNLVAAVPTLLKLMLALSRERRRYQERAASRTEVVRLEKLIEEQKQAAGRKKKRAA